MEENKQLLIYTERRDAVVKKQVTTIPEPERKTAKGGEMFFMFFKPLRIMRIMGALMLLIGFAGFVSEIPAMVAITSYTLKGAAFAAIIASGTAITTAYVGLEG